MLDLAPTRLHGGLQLDCTRWQAGLIASLQPSCILGRWNMGVLWPQSPTALLHVMDSEEVLCIESLLGGRPCGLISPSAAAPEASWGGALWFHSLACAAKELASPRISAVCRHAMSVRHPAAQGVSGFRVQGSGSRLHRLGRRCWRGVGQGPGWGRAVTAAACAIVAWV